MNNRFKLLAEQAGMTDDKFGMFFAKDKHNEDGVDLEKFAELIIKECMAIAKNWEDQLESSELLEESNAVGIVKYRIARQFGVKE